MSRKSRKNDGGEPQEAPKKDSASISAASFTQSEQPLTSLEKIAETSLFDRETLERAGKTKELMKSLQTGPLGHALKDAARTQGQFADIAKQANAIQKLIRPPDVSAITEAHRAAMHNMSGVFSRPSKAHPYSQISDMKTLGAQIRRHRKVQKLTQTDLAEMTGLGRSSISAIEAGKPSIEFMSVFTVCKTLGIPLCLPISIPPHGERYPKS